MNSPSLFRKAAVLSRATFTVCLLGAAGILFASAPAAVSTPPPGSGLSAERIKRLDAAIEESIAKKQLAGALVLIKRDGKDAYFKPFGLQDVEAGKAMQTDAIFRIASMSKAITTVTALTYYEEGKFLLKDPVSKYLPEFKNKQVAVTPPAGSPESVKYALVPAKREITIRDLMTHMAGLGYGGGPAKELWDQAGFNRWYFADRDETIGDCVKRIAQLPLNAQPGESWVYGYNTDVLGRLIEVISGKPLDQAVRERVTEPLKMVDTCFFLPPEKAGRLMNLYGIKDGKIEVRETAAKSDYITGPRKCFSGGAGLLSTASDYGRFMQMLLNDGELDGVRVLSRKTVELLQQNHAADKYTRDGGAFGLGFWVDKDLGGYGELGSEGSYGWGSAYYPQYVIDPKERMVAVYFTQLMPATGVDLMQRLRVLTYQALDSKPSFSMGSSTPADEAKRLQNFVEDVRKKRETRQSQASKAQERDAKDAGK